MKLIWIRSGLVALLCVLWLGAQACDCGPLNTRRSFCGSDKVMLAKIISVEPLGNTRLTYDVKVVKYQLLRDLKNNNTDAQGQFYTPRYQGACGVSFEAGSTALVMLSKNNEAHSCGGSETDMHDTPNEGAGDEAGQSEESKRKHAVLQEIGQLHAELQRHGVSTCNKRKPSAVTFSAGDARLRQQLR